MLKKKDLWKLDYVKMWLCENVTMWNCDYVKMWICANLSRNVNIKCDDVQNLSKRCDYVKMWLCEYVQLWLWIHDTVHSTVHINVKTTEIPHTFFDLFL